MPDQAAPDRLPAVIEGTVVERLVNAKRSPVVPAWIRDDVTRRAAAKYLVLHTAHVTAFHAARSPKYAARTLAYAPRGLGRVAGGDEWAVPIGRKSAAAVTALESAKLPPL